MKPKFWNHTTLAKALSDLRTGTYHRWQSCEKVCIAFVDGQAYKIGSYCDYLPKKQQEQAEEMIWKALIDIAGEEEKKNES